VISSVLEAIIGVVGILASVAMYYAGKKEGRRQEKGRQHHELRLEDMRRTRELVSKVADEYVYMARRNQPGPRALANLGLHLFESDALIREAIQEMYVRTGHDPWQGQSSHIEGVDLVRFFRYVREQGVDLHGSLKEAAKEVRTITGLAQ
jgi:hypothetical protein